MFGNYLGENSKLYLYNVINEILSSYAHANNIFNLINKSHPDYKSIFIKTRKLESYRMC